LFTQVWRSGPLSKVQHLDPGFCEALIKLCDELEEKEGRVADDRVRKSVRSNTVFAVQHPDLCKLVQHWATVANEEAGWNFDLSGIEPLQLSKYAADQHYGWHTDIRPLAETKGLLMRKLTFNVVLNEDYDGGDFQFSWGTPSATYKKRTIPEPAMRNRGHMVIFPSFYWHRVTPVITGTRYSLNGWITGPPFR